MDLVERSEEDGGALGAYVSGHYNEPRGGGRHNGVDIDVPTGTSVTAIKTGTVYGVVDDFEEADDSTLNGNFIRIEHENGTAGTYTHLLEADVRVGEKVQRGHVIGKSNNTGKDDGPHLHYTEWTNTDQPEYVNPAVEYPDC